MPIPELAATLDDLQIYLTLHLMKRTFAILALALCVHFTYAQVSDSTKSSPMQTLDSVDINDTLIYTEVDTPASFPGGKPAWTKFVEKNLDVSVGFENNAKFGKYNVIIKFVVMKDGTLRDFQPETKYGHGLEQEVIRVLKRSPNWIPAKKNNLKVNSVVRQNQLIVLEKG